MKEAGGTETLLPTDTEHNHHAMSGSFPGVTPKTPSGIPISIRLDLSGFDAEKTSAQREQIQLHLQLARLQLLRGFDQLLCLEGLSGVEHLPHQVETVRKVLRRFGGRVLLADEVGLGKTIEACLLLREFLLRGLARRVLILVPNPLVSQWQDELAGKFHLDFTVPPRSVVSNRASFWSSTDRVLVATSFARSPLRANWIAETPWDLVIVDEAHHCKNRKTKLWQLVNSLKRRQMFLLTATPVQNNLVELFSLLTLLEPGHLKTEAEFKKQFVTRGNPRDPRNRHKLRELLSEVMIRNTRSLVQIDLPPRFAQTIIATPTEVELQLHQEVMRFLRERAHFAQPKSVCGDNYHAGIGTMGDSEVADGAKSAPLRISRMRLQAVLRAIGSHPSAAAGSLERIAGEDPEAMRLQRLAAAIRYSAKDERLLELLKQSDGHKALVFVSTIRTLHHLQQLLMEHNIRYSTFSGEQNALQKSEAVDKLRDSVPVMLCTDSGGEGCNLQFADTLINYDLPWNPMRIEQRIGRVHRYGQTNEVFIFNLCTAGSIESKILAPLNDKIRMFELVVGEVGSILGNLEEGDEFESLVLKMWLRAGDERQLAENFEALGESLLTAQEQYLDAKNLDDALFGEDFE